MKKGYFYRREIKIEETFVHSRNADNGGENVYVRVAKRTFNFRNELIDEKFSWEILSVKERISDWNKTKEILEEEYKELTTKEMGVN